METAFWVLLVLGAVCALALVVGLLADYVGIVLLSAILGGGCLIAAGVLASIQDGREWEAFAEAHACKVVGEMSGSVFNTVGIGANGQPVIGIGSTPSKTGYQCNNGVTYWR